MSSNAYNSFMAEYAATTGVVANLLVGIPIEIARLAASGVFIQCVSRFEVFFEDVINEYCRNTVSSLSIRQQASIFNYSLNKNIFNNHAALGDDRRFIEDIEKEIRNNKNWISFLSITSINSQQLIGKKDYPKPEHILLALFKLGLEKDAQNKLSIGLNEKFKVALDRILGLRNSIAHDGIPQEWNIAEIPMKLEKLPLIAINLDNLLFDS